MQNAIQNAIQDRSRPGLSTTTIATVAQKVGGRNYATEGQRRRGRGGRRVRKRRENRKDTKVEVRVETLNVVTITGRGRELADMIERRYVDTLCVQEISGREVRLGASAWGSKCSTVV